MGKKVVLKVKSRVNSLGLGGAFIPGPGSPVGDLGGLFRPQKLTRRKKVKSVRKKKKNVRKKLSKRAKLQRRRDKQWAARAELTRAIARARR
jgi:hypothetical protein